MFILLFLNVKYGSERETFGRHPFVKWKRRMDGGDSSEKEVGQSESLVLWSLDLVYIALVNNLTIQRMNMVEHICMK